MLDLTLQQRDLRRRQLEEFVHAGVDPSERQT